MPLYEFRCAICCETFEELVTAGLDHLEVTCPKCDGEDVEKLVSRFASAGTSAGSGGGACGSGSRGFT